jgi:putative addiction module killer protein
MKSLYEKWFVKQDKEVRVQVAIALNKVMVGNTSKYKFVRDGVYEIKIHFGKGVRIYYIKETNTLYLLVGGGADKKRQAEDIKKAVEMRKYIEKSEITYRKRK